MDGKISGPTEHSGSMVQHLVRLGTRRSWLAMAQSRWVARELERLNPGLTVELFGIETKGDRIQDVPLSQIEGREFFVAELDEALRTKRVDLCVHSMKDLSLARPPEFAPFFVPCRENPRDVVVYRADVWERILAATDIPVELVIGTSAPRRLENLPEFLATALPAGPSQRGPRLRFESIRGNVNTRLSRLHEPEESGRRMDGVVLACAGLNRLLRDEEAGPQLLRILEGTRFQMLPIMETPGSPAQGALAVECRADDQKLRAVLERLHDSQAATAAAAERAVLKEWGGGCHLSLGAASVDLPGCGPVLYIKGRHPQGQLVNEIRWEAPPPVTGSAEVAFVSSEAKESRKRSRSLEKLTEQQRAALDGAGLWVVSMAAALPDELQGPASQKRLWAAGTATWRKLAARGLWVEGCAEGWGVEALTEVFAEPFVQAADAHVALLTHKRAPALSGAPWATVATASSELVKLNEALKKKLKSSRFFYWKSATAYENLALFLPRGAVRHACGPGRTAVGLKARGVEPQVFPSFEEWQSWLK